MRQHVFKSPYLGIDDGRILLTMNGDYSVIFQIQNPVMQYAADEDAYQHFHQVMDQLLQILGQGYTLQKLDVFNTTNYSHSKDSDYLSRQYFRHFQGRAFVDHLSYLVITKAEKRHRLFSSNPKAYRDFKHKIVKIKSILLAAKCQPRQLQEAAIMELIRRILTMNFNKNEISYTNLTCTPNHLIFGEQHLKCLSLVDIDQINLPPSLKTTTRLHEQDFPVDLMHFLATMEGYTSMIYHQVIQVPNQESTLQKLKIKRKRHLSMPDPANQLSVKDIDAVLEDAASRHRMLVYSHYNILLDTAKDKMHEVHSKIESQLFKLGIIPSASDHNQLELFRTILPGNTGELKSYNKFLTSSDAAICMMYKEHFQQSEPSTFQTYFTNRKGIPIAIDLNDLPLQQSRINNRNKFVLGPSGSGKSFFMNHLIRQYFQHDMDIVLVDTGHSYEGLCQYYKGQYITYAEDRPITMNPFNITKAEFNEEKREFLKALIGLLWKGTQETLTQIEDTMLSKVIHHYYAAYWKKEITQLNFNSFYAYSIMEIESIAKEEHVSFDLETYRFVLKKFYKGGHYADILNKEMEASMFASPFIVFEIDVIKEHKILFPITTLIIMDVFLQKMRIKQNRKCLIIEEAWKAIASPMMAGYILYLYKTIRKFRGEAIVVTQELDDIIGNAIVKDSIISNSDCLCLLDQSKFKDNYQEVAKMLTLNEVEQRKIFSINNLDNKEGRGRFKEVYIKRGATGEVYGIEVSLAEYLSYTTERTEKEAIRTYIRGLGSVEEALRTFVNDFRKSGMALSEFVESVNVEKRKTVEL